MKHLLTSLFILILVVPCTAQWKSVANNNQIVAFGVHDTSLFASQPPAGPFSASVYRYDPWASNLWVEADTGIDFTQGNVTSFASLGRYFFAGVTSFSGGPGTSWRTSDDGEQWSASASGNVCVAGPYVFSATGGIYRSADSGAYNPWVQVAAFNAINLAANGMCVYGSTANSLWRSTDTGNHWSQLPTPPFVGPMTVMDSLLFIVSGGNVIESSDSGTQWNAVPVDSGGTVPEYVNVLATEGKNLFAGTTAGVYLSMDMGKTWLVENTGLIYLNIDALGVFDTLLFANASGAGYYTTMRSIPEMMDTTKSGVVQTAPPSDSIEIYPNPAKGMITVLAGNTAILGVTVLNILGTDVFDVSNQYAAETEIDLSSFASGTYFVRIQTATGSVLKKITLERS